MGEFWLQFPDLFGEGEEGAVGHTGDGCVPVVGLCMSA